jgi:hypothetical protein
VSPSICVTVLTLHQKFDFRFSFQGRKCTQCHPLTVPRSTHRYGDIGTATCAGFPGLQRPDGDFSRDAQQLADWGVDAFKVAIPSRACTRTCVHTHTASIGMATRSTTVIVTLAVISHLHFVLISRMGLLVT